MSKGSIVTLTGPTASGKSTIEKELQSMGYGRAISHTTRRPRVGEVHGDAYHFVDSAQFEELRAAGEFIELIDLGTRRYGMSKAALHAAMAAGREGNGVIVVDPHGAAQIKAYCRQQGIHCFSVWVDCAPKEQARRWLTRTLSDLVIGPEAMDAQAERLSIMLTEEVQWRENARSWRIDNSWNYSIKLDTGSGFNPKDYAITVDSQLKRAQVA